MPDRNDGLNLADQLCFAVYSAAHAFNRVYKPHLDRLGLTYPQYLAMLVLWERDDVTVKAIGERLALDSGTLTPLLKRLESAGLVRRLRDPADERSVRVSLTDQGRKLRDKARGVPIAMACAIGRSLPEISQLKDELAALRDALDVIAHEAAAETV
ncbi:MarR family winged helix-turn-helix transcriptional regulator [Phreatobacter stygius]|uniref:MarR family transcriptional regulator n=1 Tax=Phreatobacter stygius TaxID=1940610 RepID=A0A4D7B7R1_9HYPH|nr:MarR family transcriptional regulator [Phreatobacter stygius]QCI65676.1 MarR family transcriptional regulator [Phreatobacter stygius]